MKYRQHDDNAIGINKSHHRIHQSFWRRTRRLAEVNLKHIDESIQFLALLQTYFPIKEPDNKKMLAFLRERKRIINEKKPMKLLLKVNKKINEDKVYTIKDFWHDLRSVIMLQK